MTIVAGKYEVRGVLGEGGTGTVYDAVALDSGAPIALKVMHPHLAGDAQVRGRFRREAAVLGRLRGDRICTLVDFGEVTGESGAAVGLYLAMPKIDGPSVESLIGEGELAVDRVLEIMIEVCAALEVAHEQGVVHRDLKPANVILEGGARVVVVDFGLSKIVTGGGTGTTNLTTHNMVFGTPEYMSPEQARGDEIDGRCDVYAAGVMLYQLLTGVQPFTGDTPLKVLTAHLTEPLKPPSAIAPERVTKALEAVVFHALAREREDRYPNAHALAEAIERARRGPQEVHAVSPTAFASTLANVPSAPAVEGAPPSASSERPVTTQPPPETPRATDQPELQSDRRASSTRRNSNSQTTLRRGERGPTSSRTDDAPTTSRTWVIAWILAACVSIAVGVYLALR